ncbi:hypothetical protein L1987_44794 [Smallanthus sonchifolius]|uniref:Uncharacterized protein n=1 Tax=Smallanthus sonchifolius TaxID=185202 RepID=A0ACB9GQB0_9ASTR|nr:hypothetical protein L1987_44794 [Smallanthus sonchifolius]
MFTKVINERICYYFLGNEGYGYEMYIMGLYLLGAYVAGQMLYNWGDDVFEVWYCALRSAVLEVWYVSSLPEGQYGAEGPSGGDL